MPFELQSDKRYRMPVVFGPSVGPRQGPKGERFDSADAPKTMASVSFLSEVAALEALLPRGFSLSGEPIVTVEYTYFRELQWLAGRGYNTLGVKIPARFEGAVDNVTGSFLTVLWENMCEPILSGREELGYAKLYCELPEPQVLGGDRHYKAVWDGHRFMTMKLWDLEDSAPPAATPTDGTLHYRYFPAVNDVGKAESQTAVLGPAGGVDIKVDSYRQGKGSVTFVPTTWEQMPTMFHIANTLAALPVLESRGASLVHSRGAKDLSDQRLLR